MSAGAGGSRGTRGSRGGAAFEGHLRVDQASRTAWVTRGHSLLPPAPCTARPAAWSAAALLEPTLEGAGVLQPLPGPEVSLRQPWGLLSGASDLLQMSSRTRASIWASGGASPGKPGALAEWDTKLGGRGRAWWCCLGDLAAEVCGVSGPPAWSRSLAGFRSCWLGQCPGCRGRLGRPEGQHLTLQVGPASWLGAPSPRSGPLDRAQEGWVWLPSPTPRMKQQTGVFSVPPRIRGLLLSPLSGLSEGALQGPSQGWHGVLHLRAYPRQLRGGEPRHARSQGGPGLPPPLVLRTS